ncbi:MAG: M20/M25/M40 family metallo-hydrolase [Oscillospiraceae bacterium]|nr:M20/M25/M40 family metallo-hydrolase [Oscillospiraceae bacterium]
MEKTRRSDPYIKDQIYDICTRFKNRAGGTDSEQNCQHHFANQLAAWSDSVTEEKFTLHPGAFMGCIIPSSLLTILAVLLYWVGAGIGAQFFTILGFVCTSAAILLFVLEFALYYRFTDRLYPAATSINVFARRKPSGETKRRIIFGGHADAAFEMTYSLHPSEKSGIRVFIAAIIGEIYIWCISVAALIQAANVGHVTLSGAWLVLGVIALIPVPAFISCLFFINWTEIVDGANDNLSGSLVAMCVLKEMEETGVRLENTEVCCLITGSEEEGLRGSKAFAKKHKHDFDDVETIFIALDTLREVNQLQVYTRGINGTQKNSEYVANLLRAAGKNCGIAMKDAGIYPGATDAEAFSREGLLSCGMCGVDHMPQTYYHTRFDTPDNICEECLDLSLDICMEAARLYDEQVK